MILRNQITEIGHINKPHGIKGEFSAIIYPIVNLNTIRCIVIEIEGIYVPFFIKSFRSRGKDAILMTIDGVGSEEEAMALTRKSIYALKGDCIANDGNEETNKIDVEDLINYVIIDEEDNVLGKISDIDDSTENVLFIVETANGRELLVPATDDFIDEIDNEKLIIKMSLPEGLTEL